MTRRDQFGHSSSLRAHEIKQKLLELPLFAADEPFL